jgi:hypothetical protein
VGTRATVWPVECIAFDQERAAVGESMTVATIPTLLRLRCDSA